MRILQVAAQAAIHRVFNHDSFRLQLPQIFIDQNLLFLPGKELVRCCRQTAVASLQSFQIASSPRKSAEADVHSAFAFALQCAEK
jgi:hypothetical protein